MSTRSPSRTGALARLGFDDATRAERLFRDPTLATLVDDTADVPPGGLAEGLGRTSDPDLALLSVVRLLEAAPDADALRAVLADDTEGRARLLAVLGASTALADHLVGHPATWTDATDAAPRDADTLRARLVDAVTAALDGEGATAPASADAVARAHDALRVAYRRELVAIAALDLTGDDPRATMEPTARALADIASAALEAGLTCARAEVGPDADAVRLAVMGMGKCGGRELNYVSDVDVIFVAEPTDADASPEAEAAALTTGTTLAGALMRACAASTREGSLWPVDAALRPEGKQGPLVRTVASHQQYYQRWAKTWEFQALLKARHVAGDADLAADYLAAVSPMVWQAASRENFVEDVQAMRRRVEAHVPAREAGRQLKLGPGGLRDVEFSVQLLQLVHGRTDESLRSGTTLQALEALAAGGYVGRDDAQVLDEAYRHLRAMEHRIQLYRMRRTHLVPTAAADLRRLGRSMGLLTDPEKAVVEEWQRRAREVRRLHERLFYRPLLSAVARLGADSARLAPEAARERLAALGFRDPAGAMRHLEALTEGYSRAAAIQRTLLPAMLGWFAAGADPDAGLLAFRKLSDELGGTHWYLKMLRDEGDAAQRLAHVLSSSRFAAQLLERSAASVAILGDADGLTPRDRDALATRMRSAARRKDTRDEAVAAVRAVRRAELLRVAVADLTGIVDLAGVGEALTTIASATVEACLDIAVRAVEDDLGEPLGTRLLVVGMGRFGGGELGYGSDGDVIVVHDPTPEALAAGLEEAEATRRAAAVVTELRRITAAGGPEPALALDIDLRPEGKNGPLVRTLDSYRQYYERWADTWERQALVRAEPVAGDADLGRRFLEVIDPFRYPADGLDATALRGIRRLKARMESERLPRGGDRRTHLKLGIGGLSDVEWTVQVIQLEHAHDHPGLRTTRTLAALHAARDADLIGADDATVLEEAWVAASRVRDAGMLWRGRAMDSLPGDLRDADGVARIVGLPPGEGQAFLDAHLRRARRARAVVDRLFYGLDPAVR